jgi:hypothetical protein
MTLTGSCMCGGVTYTVEGMYALKPNLSQLALTIFQLTSIRLLCAIALTARR